MALKIAEWQPWGAALLSHEDGPNGGAGFLGVAYTDNVDTRWHGMACLGPKMNTLDCSARGGTVANMNDFAVAPISMNANGPFLYGSGGTKWAKISLTGGTSALTLASNGTEGAMAEATTSCLYTKNAAGTEEISFGMDNTAYRVITTVGNTTTDTDVANASSYKARIIRPASSDSGARQIALLGRGTGTAMNIAGQNTLSGTVTMATPTPTTRATIGGEAITFTAFALDGDKWILGTSNGPYYLDADFQSFRPLLDELDNDVLHCAQMHIWGVLGPSVVIPLRRSMRLLRYLQGKSAGPEVFRQNHTPVTGSVTAFAASERWAYMPIYNPVTDQTYVCAVRPAIAGDWHSYPLSYFPIATLGAGVESRAAIFTGTQGNTARTMPMVVLGYDSDIAYFNEGRVDYFPNDTGYTYALSGTLYLTQMEREPDSYKKLAYFDIETENCSATQTVTLSVAVTDRYGNASTIQVGGPITSNGIHRLRVTESFPIDMARTIEPRVAFSTGAATASPMIVAPIRMAYELRPMNID